VLKPSKFKLSGSPGRSNKLNPILMAVFLLVWQMSGAVALLTLKKYTALDENQQIIIASLASQFLAVFVGIRFGSHYFSNGALRGMGLTPRRWINDSIRSVIAYIAILPVCLILLQLTTMWALRIDPEFTQTHPFLEILQSPTTTTFWRSMVIFSAVVMAPFCEEIVFRGLLQSMIRKYTKSPWLSILVVSVLFAAIHCSADIKSVPALFALSLALGYNYERTGRLYSPIMIHMIFNAVMIAQLLNS
jgi:membrane protease YdiL (CAAX protease family)